MVSARFITFMEIYQCTLITTIFPTPTVLAFLITFFTRLIINCRKTPHNMKRDSMIATIYDFPPQEFLVSSTQIPSYGPDEVLVEVKASSINPVDYKLKTSQLPIIRWFFPWNAGRDFAGIVIAKGNNVKKFNIGDEVFGNACGGSLQEYSIARQNEISLKPTKLNFVEAASIGLAGATSLQALKWFKTLTHEDTVLIIGASGGCGGFGVQIAKSYGSKVYGVCSAKNVELVKGFGCDVILDYTNPNFLDDLKDVKFDIIYDTVSSPEDADQEVIFRKYLKGTGKYVAINGARSDMIRGQLGCERQGYHCHLLKWNTEDLNDLRDLVENNLVKIMSIQTFRLTQEDIDRAFGLMASRRTVGKLSFEI